MKTKQAIRITVILLVCGVFICIADNSEAVIGYVDIIPGEPTINDEISIFVSGGEPYGPVDITDSIFNINGKSLGLDLYLDVGFLTVVTPWTHSEEIGFFPAGTYNLTVNTFDESRPIHNDTFETSFTVIPEPTSFILVTLGSIIIRTKKPYKRK
jgi:hypothetical protein